MTIIVETGQLDLNANSYASVAQADARHAASTSAEIWDGFDLPLKEQRLVTATRKLDVMFDWLGEPVLWDQPLGWPRRRLTDPYGRHLNVQGVPVPIRNAAIDLALWLPADIAVAPLSAATSEGVVEEIVLGPIEIKMASSSSVAAPVHVPADVVIFLRSFGRYLGGSGGVGRLIR